MVNCGEGVHELSTRRVNPLTQLDIKSRQELAFESNEGVGSDSSIANGLGEFDENSCCRRPLWTSVHPPLSSTQMVRSSTWVSSPFLTYHQPQNTTTRKEGLPLLDTLHPVVPLFP